MQDEIVDEVRRIREEHAARFAYDVDAIYADLKRLEKEGKGPRASFGPRRLAKAISNSVRKRRISPGN
jgi:hypothetical protein